MLLIKKCIKHTLALLIYTDTPSCWSHWMDNNCIWGSDVSSIMFLQRKNEIAILAPGCCEALIKAPNQNESVAPEEAVSGYKLALCKMRCVVFVISSCR